MFRGIRYLTTGAAASAAAAALLATGCAAAPAAAPSVAEHSPAPTGALTAASGVAFSVCSAVGDNTIAAAGFDPRTRTASTVPGVGLPSCGFTRHSDGAVVTLVSNVTRWNPRVPTTEWVGHPATIDGRDAFVTHPTTYPGCTVELRRDPVMVEVTLAERGPNTCADTERIAGVIGDGLPNR